jgi:Mor family transcriptional regulator
VLLLSWLSKGFPQPKTYNFKVRKQIERNETIRRRFANGEDTITLAQEYGMSRKRIYQIIRGQHT